MIAPNSFKSILSYHLILHCVIKIMEIFLKETCQNEYSASQKHALLLIWMFEWMHRESCRYRCVQSSANVVIYRGCHGSGSVLLISMIL